MSDHSYLDNHVAHAWRTKKFSNGTKIELGRVDFEHAFVVKPNGIYEVGVLERGMYKCKGGFEGPYTSFDFNQIKPHAGGHTHPRGNDGRTAPYPGPNDGRFAKMAMQIGMPTYVLSSYAAYKVEFVGNEFSVSVIAGSKGYSREIRKVIKRWMGAVNKSAIVNDLDCRMIPMTKEELR